jgi:hypothetical protein
MWESAETPHRDSVREFTTVLRQWSNTRVPGELHFGTSLLSSSFIPALLNISCKRFTMAGARSKSSPRQSALGRFQPTTPLKKSRTGRLNRNYLSDDATSLRRLIRPPL